MRRDHPSADADTPTSSICTSTPSTACSTAPRSSRSWSSKAKELTLPGPRAHRPRQPLRRRRLLHRLREGGRQADPGLRALRGAGQPQRARRARTAATRARTTAPCSCATGPATRNLIKLVSKAYLEGFYYKPRVDRELLAQHADGLLVLSGCLNSEVSRAALARATTPRRSQTAGWYQEVFGKDHYFMEVQSHGLEEQMQGDGGHASRSPRRSARPSCGHQRLALPRGRARARPRGAALHPDRHDA